MKLREGVVVCMLGLIGIIFGLANQSLTMMEKVAINIVCMGVIVLGILIETPILEQIRNKPDENKEFKDFKDSED